MQVLLCRKYDGDFGSKDFISLYYLSLKISDLIIPFVIHLFFLCLHLLNLTSLLDICLSFNSMIQIWV